MASGRIRAYIVFVSCPRTLNMSLSQNASMMNSDWIFGYPIFRQTHIISRHDMKASAYAKTALGLDSIFVLKVHGRTFQQKMQPLMLKTH